jgi:D-threonate/D-erythronate kinase
MLVVLSDDFSGAAEIGGIAHRYGLRTEIQLSLNVDSSADVIVLDTDTRMLSESDAIRKISDIGVSIKTLRGSPILFKKVDSVMRGHLVSEVNALFNIFQFGRVLILPANPSRGRIIQFGKYFIEGKPLDESIFSQDPDFPATSADIAIKMIHPRSNLTHLHVSPGDTLPNGMLITGNIQSKDDLKKYVSKTNESDLCCGAAELFEVFLENLGYAPQATWATQSHSSDTAYTLIVNGSTVKNANEITLYAQSEIAVLSLPAKIEGTHFLFSEKDALVWRKMVLDALTSRRAVVVSIDQPIQHSKTMSEMFLKQFIVLIQYITDHMNMNKIHFCLTGGATASSIIRHLEQEKLFVKNEIIPGVVTLAMINNKEEAYFTIKPGSYAWPSSIVKNLQAGKN